MSPPRGVNWQFRVGCVCAAFKAYSGNYGAVTMTRFTASLGKSWDYTISITIKLHKFRTAIQKILSVIIHVNHTKIILLCNKYCFPRFLLINYILFRLCIVYQVTRNILLINKKIKLHAHLYKRFQHFDITYARILKYHFLYI